MYADCQRQRESGRCAHEDTVMAPRPRSAAITQPHLTLPIQGHHPFAPSRPARPKRAWSYPTRSQRHQRRAGVPPRSGIASEMAAVRSRRDLLRPVQRDSAAAEGFSRQRVTKHGVQARSRRFGRVGEPNGEFATTWVSATSILDIAQLPRREPHSIQNMPSIVSTASAGQRGVSVNECVFG